jgi:hypothetical protein
MFAWLLLTLLGFIGIGVLRYRYVRRPPADVSETEKWLDQLYRYARDRELESRSHPELAIELEACAHLHREIENSLESDEWNTLTTREPWQRVRSVCREASEELLIDALWASSTVFCKRGGHLAAFAKRCADPAFAGRQINSVRLCRAKLERLLGEVCDEPFSSAAVVDPLARAEAELSAIRAAEEELRYLP